MSAMSDELYDEAIIDVVKPETLLCEPCVVKVCHLLYVVLSCPSITLQDLILSDISPRELNRKNFGAYIVDDNPVVRQEGVKSFEQSL